VVKDTVPEIMTSLSWKRTHRGALILLAINSILSSTSLFGYNGRYCIVIGGGGVFTVEAAEDSRRQKRKQQEQPRRNRSSSGSGSSNSNNNNNRSRSQANENQSNDYYSILNVKKNAKLKDIKKAYRKLALKYHVSGSSSNNTFITVAHVVSTSFTNTN
jgi:hypothetical protein